MSRSLPWFWIVLALLVLLLPGPAGRLLLNVLGGLTLTVLLLPVLAAGVAVIGWQILQTRLHTCPACDLRSFSTDYCPGCGASMQVAASGQARATRQGPSWVSSRFPGGLQMMDLRDAMIEIGAIDDNSDADAALENGTMENGAITVEAVEVKNAEATKSEESDK